jgi:hypothetical protein
MKHVILHMASGEKVDCYTEWSAVEAMLCDDTTHMMIATGKNNTKPRLMQKNLIESYEIIIGGEL